MNASFDEPTIPPRLQRPLAAAWISLGLHAAVIALVQVTPPARLNPGAPVIEARLVPAQAALPAVAPPVAPPVAPSPPEAKVPPPTPEKLPLLAPSEPDKALPLAKPVVAPPVEAAVAAAAPPAEPAVAAAAPAAPAPAPPAAPAPVVAIASSVDLTYYSAREVDVHPRALGKIVPDYPADADRRRLSGKVQLQLKLEDDGRISDIDVVSAMPPGIFEDSAIRAFRDARFAPAQKNGQPVRAKVLIEVVYDWEGHAR